MKMSAGRLTFTVSALPVPWRALPNSRRNFPWSVKFSSMSSPTPLPPIQTTSLLSIVIPCSVVGQS